MTTKVVPGILVATPDGEQAAQEAAARMARAMREAIGARGRAAIALSGGNTPRAAYALLARDPKIDWSRVDVFFVDERAVPPASDRSNWRMVKEALLDPAKISEDHAFRMRAAKEDNPDLADAAREYEALVRKHVRAASGSGAPTFDLVVLGIGDDGHTASLFPGRPEVDVTDKLVVAVPAREQPANGPAVDPREPRLSCTAPLVESARHVMILALGKAKNAPLERVWSVVGDVHETPARIVRGARGAITWVIDRAAGGMG